MKTMLVSTLRHARFAVIALAIIVLCAVAPRQAHATLLANDSFSYATGSAALNGKTGGSGWCSSGSVGWFTTGTGLDIASGSLDFSKNSLALSTSSNSVTTGTTGQNDYRKVTTYYGQSCTGSGNPLFISFTARQKSSVTSQAGYCGVSLFSSDQSACSATAGTGPEQFFIGKRNGTGNSVWGFQYAGGTGTNTSVSFDNTTRLVLVKLTQNGTSGKWEARMWIDPSLTNAPSDGVQGTAAGYNQVTNIALSGSTCFDKFRIESGNGSAWDVDELRFGTTFADVVPVQAPTVSLSQSAPSTCAAGSITFTAYPTNAGPNPTYVWKTNNVTVTGETSNTYTRSGDWVNGDTVSVTVTQDVGTSGLTAQNASSTNTITVTANVTPSVSVSVNPGTTICTGTQVIFTATPVNGGTPTYQWYTNGIADTGGTFASYTNSGLLNGDQVYVVMTSTDVCRSQDTATSATNTMSVSATTMVGTISPATTNFCSSGSLTLTLSGYVGAIQWQSTNYAGGFTNIPGATSDTYTTPALTATRHYRAAVTNSPCSGDYSAVATVTVSPTPAEGTVSPTTTNFCTSGSLTLTLAGSTGSIQWQASPDNVTFTNISGATSTTYATPTISEATYYRAVLSSGICTPATSSVASVTITLPATVTADPQATNACVGSTATFSATVSGTSPSIRWRKGHWGQNWSFNNGSHSQNDSTLNAGGASGGINSSNGKAWKIFNPGANTTNEASRTFPYSILPVGTNVQIDMDNGYLNDLVLEGFELINGSGNRVWSFYFRGGDDRYSVNGSTNVATTGFTGNGLRITFSLTTATNYSATVIRNIGSGTKTTNTYTGVVQNPSGGTNITGIRFFARSNGANNSSVGQDGDLFFNNLTVGAYSDDSGNYSSWTGDSSGTLLSDGGNVTGATTSQLTINPVSLSDALNYDVVVTNSCATNSSQVAALTVNTLPSATVTAPSSICAGASSSASVPDAGVGATYGWTITGNGTIDSGADTATVNFTATTSGGLTLTCSVTNASGCVSTGSSNLTVVANPAITADLDSQTNICSGGTLTLSISATPPSATYQWYTNGVAISGATSSSYTNSSVTVGDSAGYYVVVTGCAGATATSQTNQLTVNPTSVGGTLTAAASTVCTGSGTTITNTGYTGSIQWQARVSGAFTNIPGATSDVLETGNLTATTDFRAVVTSGVCASAFSTTNTVAVSSLSVGGTAVPAGTNFCTSGSLTLTLSGATGSAQWEASPDNVTFTNIPGATSSSYATPTITENTYYRAVVTSGACSSATSSVASVTINLAPSVTTDPTNYTVCSGGNASFSIAASGSPLNYAWRKNGSGWGTNGAWTFNNDGGTISESGFFVASAAGNGGNGSINTSSKSWGMYANGGKVARAVRRFNAMPVGQQLRLSMANGLIDSGGTVGFGLRNASSNNLFEIYFKGGTNFYKVNDLTGERNTTVGFTRDGISVVFVLTSPSNYSVTITPSGGSPYTTTGQLMNPSGGQSIAQLRLFNANAGTGGDHDSYFNSVTIPGGYDDTAAGYSTQSGNVGWLYTAGTNNNGGQGPLSNGGSISGADTASLTLSGVTTNDNGAQYTCQLNNSCGVTTSSAATLTVNPTPTAANDSYNRTPNLSLKISKTNLLANDSAGAGFVSFSSPTTNGITLSEDATFIYYPSNATNLGDIFTYIVTNSSGCSATATVTINITQPATVQSISVTNGGSSVTANFAGIPDYPYAIERATNVTFTLGTNTWYTNAPVGGLFQLIDTFSDLGVPPNDPPSQAYYRLRYNP